MKPTVGRVVHYQSYGTPGGERAAIITAVARQPDYPGDEEEMYTVSICVLNPTGMFFNEGVPFAPDPTPGHWNWPPRE